MPDSVVEIGSHAFNGCTSLRTVSLPFGEIRVAPDAFVDCPNVRVVKRTATQAEAGRAAGVKED